MKICYRLGGLTALIFKAFSFLTRFYPQSMGTIRKWANVFFRYDMKFLALRLRPPPISKRSASGVDPYVEAFKEQQMNNENEVKLMDAFQYVRRTFFRILFTGFEKQDARLNNRTKWDNPTT